MLFVEKVDEGAFLDYCTVKLCASIVEGDHCDLRWRGEDATVWARDVRGTLAGDFLVPQEVTKCLGVATKSAVVLEMGEHPSSEYIGFLVALALLRRWSGCIAVPEDLLMLSSTELTDTFGNHRPLRSISGGGGSE